MSVALNPDALLYDARKAMMMGMLWRLERGQCVNCETPTRGLTCMRMDCAIAFEWLNESEQGMLWRFWCDQPRYQEPVQRRKRHPWRSLAGVVAGAVGLTATWAAFVVITLPLLETWLVGR